MNWFIKKKIKPLDSDRKVKIAEGMWEKCQNCKEIVYKKEIEKNYRVCPKCNYHFRISAEERIRIVADEGSFLELDAGLASTDPLHFKDSRKYKDRLKEGEKLTGKKDAVVYGDAEIQGYKVVLAVFDFGFMGGSMGSVVGEKITRAIERAVSLREPFISFSSSGGARMQEGAISLMQMAKTSAAVSRLGDAGMPFISILTDPTFGGVTASFAMLGDIILAEPRALIGFAGPRVIEQTIREKLPEGFQRAEFLLKHGMVDRIVERKEMKKTLAGLLSLFWYV
ncbi:MAG: acetyl-CoA carboxylase carboxyl transferase subunit beta [Nitrospirae bacterium CG_4_9_14_3_um_filter_53_35]|nr:MAG: acetyl-CoA carboxylase subunit beta [Nitrospirae bacterium CG2_30_53_67]PIS37237.1 MAG: acetyl-CoA carboxylase carboxyl transferase subunit beta [Nitrospirae bacterium CG08_land_8_20_14_0_20_52_24]PIV83032.1 MAG: acetyl-CoA carboxylase carboxyl transferase subunit beta [Nitrospirae bacterium CG17_big_fil_post_rev_8_21_14_2_50_50_9]PIW85093.1 MAG: acetyl-CoA carboxylase carboxyl transferase subunit beta [Nitrospirae bacterium CG_4_8_14_3_um_filter_50_41]PIX85963.1 MAG: acetyl-CoA carboxy